MIILFFAVNKEPLLVNIYGPNKDNPDFYQSLSETVKRYKNHNVVIVGDWNLVLDSQLYCYNYKHINNPKAKEVVKNMILELELTDVWRENNPQCKRYTWWKPNPLKQTRLDFILLSDHLMWHFDDADILPGYRFHFYAQAQIWKIYKAQYLLEIQLLTA